MSIVPLIDGIWSSKNSMTTREIAEGINYDPDHVEVEVSIKGSALQIDVYETWMGKDYHQQVAADINLFSEQSKDKDEWLQAVKDFVQNEMDDVKDKLRKA